MALKTPAVFSFAPPIPPPSSSSSRSPFPSSVLLRPKTPKTPIPPFAAAPSLPPIFLPHLEEDEIEEEFVQGSPEPQQDPEPEEDSDDPVLSFFRRRAPPEDPKRQGRLSLQRNRRTAWHVADLDDGLGGLGEEEEVAQVADLGCGLDVSSPHEDGVVGDVLRVARNLPENSTLGELMEPFVGRIGERECLELLQRMGEEGLVSGCLYLFEWMRLQEPPLVTPRACSVIFPVLGRAGAGEKIMVLFENLPRAKEFRDVRVYNSVISGLADCRRYDDAWKIFELLEANNIRPDHVTCSILITVMRKSGKCAKDAWQFFERMNRKGVNWSLEVVGALMKSFCDEGLKKEALIIQSEMEKKGIPSNAIIYNTLMSGYCESDQVEEAEGLLTEMKERGLQPTTATYNILMDAYSRRMQPEIVEALLTEMQNSGLNPNVKSYTCLISAYGRQRKMSEQAANSFLKMKKAGIKPTSHSYTALIHAYSVGGWHEKAYIAFENMKREGIKPSIETYTAILDAFRRAGETGKLMEIWKSMINNKVEGTRVTFNIVLDGLAKYGLYVQARDVIHEFAKIGLQPTVMTYNILMNAYARGGQHYKLPHLLKEMAALSLKPDSVTYATVIYAYIRVRDFTKAFYYHKQMVRSRHLPDTKSYQKMRAILDVKAATKNRRDRSAILGIVNSKFGIKPKKGKKDEFWKNRKKQSIRTRPVGD